jgi:putative endonuclease
VTDARIRKGASSDAAGRAAEAIAEARYRADGYAVLARRWRGPSGEIDLVCQGHGGLVFVEVKAARDFEAAAARLTARQVHRIRAAALEFLAAQDRVMDLEMRFDIACVDRIGRCIVLENMLAA